MENAPQANGKGAAVTPYRPSLARAAGLAAVLLAVDCFLFNQGMIALGVGLWLVVIAVPMALVRKRYAGMRLLRLRDVAILLASVPLVWFVNIQQNRLAKSRADTMVEAINAYKAKEGRWPAMLGDVVPAYLPEVPRAKYVVMFGDFRYRHQPTPVLEYTAFPPFGRPQYRFEKQKWTYLD